MANELEKELAAKEAVKFIKDGQVIGLGTGSTAYFAIVEVGKLVKNGWKIQAVPTSENTRELAALLHIPLVDINTIDAIDITIDGADEFTEKLELIKGGGGALLREKIVASLTKTQLIITDISKKVAALGAFTLPIEVIPFASSYVIHQLKKINGIGKVRTKNGENFITDQGNIIVDTDFGLIKDPAALAKQIDTIVGVVEHGLFINLSSKIIMGVEGKVVVFE